MNYEIVIMCHNPELGKPVQESLSPLPSRIFNGANYPSFSKLVNDCVVSTKPETEIVVLCSYKVRPTPSDVERMITLINQGHGMVCLYRFAFFGFKKELLRRIGMLDERYLGGGYEDSDTLRRVLLHNISYYEDECVEYLKQRSTWKYASTKPELCESYRFFKSKWREDSTTVTQIISDEGNIRRAQELFGKPDFKITFLDASQSKLLTPNFEKKRFIGIS